MSKIQGINERDWKLFRSKLPDWQERYMDKLNHEYMELLSGEGRSVLRIWRSSARNCGRR